MTVGIIGHINPTFEDEANIEKKEPLYPETSEFSQIEFGLICPHHNPWEPHNLLDHAHRRCNNLYMEFDFSPSKV